MKKLSQEEIINHFKNVEIKQHLSDKEIVEFIFTYNQNENNVTNFDLTYPESTFNVNYYPDEKDMEKCGILYEDMGNLIKWNFKRAFKINEKGKVNVILFKIKYKGKRYSLKRESKKQWWVKIEINNKMIEEKVNLIREIEKQKDIYIPFSFITDANHKIRSPKDSGNQNWSFGSKYKLISEKLTGFYSDGKFYSLDQISVEEIAEILNK